MLYKSEKRNWARQHFRVGKEDLEDLTWCGCVNNNANETRKGLCITELSQRVLVEFDLSVCNKIWILSHRYEF